MLNPLPVPPSGAPTVLVIPADPALAQAAGRKQYRQLRVAAYARVSTKEEEQQNSFETQKTYYEDKINANPAWTLQGIYADAAVIIGLKTLRLKKC